MFVTGILDAMMSFDRYASDGDRITARNRAIRQRAPRHSRHSANWPEEKQNTRVSVTASERM